MSSSIKISNLNELFSITSDDFFPVDDSGSMTTYRISMSTLLGFLSASGSIVTSSFARTASYAISSSYALTSSYAVSSSRSITSSFAIVASWATNSLSAVSSSYQHH